MPTQLRVLVSAILGLGLLLLVCSLTKPAGDMAGVLMMLAFVFAAGATAGWQITAKN